VKGHHRRKVAGRDRRLAGAHREIARQLRPECRLKCKIFTGHGHAGIGEPRAGERDVIAERSRAPGPRLFALLARCLRIISHDLQREVMIAHHELVTG